MYQAITLSAGVAVQFKEAGDFFRLLAAPAQDVELIFYAMGREVGRAENVGAGYAERFGMPFDEVRLTSTSGGAAAFVVRLGNEVRYDTPPNGNVTLTGGAHVNTRATVTEAAAVTLLAANGSRRFLLVQNNDAAVALRLRCDGTAPTASTGLRIAAGGSLLLDVNVPTGAIKAIYESATSAAVEVQEG